MNKIKFLKFLKIEPMQEYLSNFYNNQFKSLHKLSIDKYDCYNYSFICLILIIILNNQIIFISINIFLNILFTSIF
jgi:hypothetical protein